MKRHVSSDMLDEYMTPKYLVVCAVPKAIKLSFHTRLTERVVPPDGSAGAKWG